MSAGHTFSEQQRRFFALLTDLRPLPRALEEGAAHGVGLLPLAAWLRAPDERAAARRIEIYRDMRLFRLVESLQQDFPSAHAVLGDEGFASLVREYLAEYPSHSPSLRDLGEAFPEFVRKHAVMDARADLADLCALDWARLCAFDAKDTVPITEQEIAALPPETWGDFGVALIPAHRLLRSQHAIESAWLALDRGETPPEPEAGSRTILVWKRAFDVRHRALEPAEDDCVVAALRGLSLAALCECFAQADAGPAENIGERVFTRLRQWVVDGLLVRDA
jgi:hypothetical protein